MNVSLKKNTRIVCVSLITPISLVAKQEMMANNICLQPFGMRQANVSMATTPEYSRITNSAPIYVHGIFAGCLALLVPYTIWLCLASLNWVVNHRITPNHACSAHVEVAYRYLLPALGAETTRPERGRHASNMPRRRECRVPNGSVESGAMGLVCVVDVAVCRQITMCTPHTIQAFAATDSTRKSLCPSSDKWLVHDCGNEMAHTCSVRQSQVNCPQKISSFANELPGNGIDIVN